MNNSGKRVEMQGAVFSDVEGTLVDGSLPEIFLATGRRINSFTFRQKLLITPLELVGNLLPSKLRRTFKLLALLVAVKGHTVEEVSQINEAVIPEVIGKLKPTMAQKLRQHREAGLPIVLVSAGMHEAIARIGQELEARGEGTKIKQANGRYLAKVDGELCQGEGKAARAREVLAEMGYDPAQSFAYGDTGSDAAFLALFAHPAVVDPDQKLEAIAREKGWEIIRTK